MKKQTTTQLVSEAQSILFSDAVEASVNGVDLNLKGFSLNGNEDFVLSGTEANINRVRFWLYSMPGDYVREPGRGGPLYATLGKPLTLENADAIDRDITLSFNSFFSGDLTLLNTSVVPDAKSRRWKITLFVNDPVRREFFNIALGVASA